MYCVKCGKQFPFECLCDDKEERLAALSGVVVFPTGDGRYMTPAPVQPKQRKTSAKADKDGSGPRLGDKNA